MAEHAVDDFWSVAFLSNNDTPLKEHESDDEHQNICTSSRAFTILTPKTTDGPSTEEPLTINMQLNNTGGVLDDVSGIPWDASLLLAGYLYGTHEGRRLCLDACSSNSRPRTGGILELGSGLGIVGITAIAVVAKFASETVYSSNTIVLTDRNNNEILACLKRNVDANISKIQIDDCNPSYQKRLDIYVEACDWMEVSTHLKTDIDETIEEDTLQQFPKGPFNLILGSALVYIPDHAAACADTIDYYLSDSCSVIESKGTAPKRQAIIVQLPDRSGFTTHFLPRCHELGLNVECRELDEGLIERVEAGLDKTIASARDFRMFVITK